MNKQDADLINKEEPRPFQTIEGIRHVTELQEEGRRKLGEHLASISRMLVLLTEFHDRLDVAIREANQTRAAAAATERAELNEGLAALALRFDTIDQGMERLADLRDKTELNERLAALTSRFDKLDHEMDRLTDLRDKTELNERLAALTSRFDKLDHEMDRLTDLRDKAELNERLAALTSRFDKIDHVMDRLTNLRDETQLSERLAALTSRFDKIDHAMHRLTDLREKADIHHSGLFALLLNGQMELRTNLAEIKYWVTASALRGQGAASLVEPPVSEHGSPAAAELVDTSDAGCTVGV